MRGNPSEVEVTTPKTLSDALGLLASDPKLKPLAGGTDLMVLFAMGKLPAGRLMDLWQLRELRGIEVNEQTVTLGALTTYTEVQADPVLSREFPMLGKAGSETGGLAIQNRGTLGGNVANASPAADTPPALLVYDAQLELISAAGGSRWLAYSEFHTGYKQTLMRPDELLGRIRLPRRDESWRHYYRKVGTRKAQAISKTCLAGAVRVEGRRVREIRLAVGSVAPTVVRCLQTEAVLSERQLDAAAIHDARETLAREITPIDDVRSTASYRLRVSQNLLEEMLTECFALA